MKARTELSDWKIRCFLEMNKQKIINTLKSAYQNIRIMHIKTTGVLATRLFVAVLFIPVILVVAVYAYMVVYGFSDSLGKLVDTGLKVISGIFATGVLASVVGFLGLWVDKDGDGIPDKLEDDTNDKRI